MEYVASISYGKDSLAMLEIIKRNNLPLDRIVHVEIMATSSIPADLPDIIEWKQYADKVILDRYDIKVEHIKSKLTYENLFYQIPKRTNKNQNMQGMIRGFPSLRSQWCSRDLKVKVMKSLNKSINTIQYIGIAYDEEKRLNQLNKFIRSPLVENKITEEECLEICESIGLLAPTYLYSKRNGCWFCHAQPVGQLRILRKKYPQLWNLLLKWDKDSPIPFRHKTRNGKYTFQTLHNFDKRFKLEDIGILDKSDKTFRWDKLKEYKKIKKRGI